MDDDSRLGKGQSRSQLRNYIWKDSLRVVDQRLGVVHPGAK